MLKLKSLINVFWVMAILFCFYSIDSSTAYAFNSPKGNENVIVDQCPKEDSEQGSGGVPTITGDHNYTDNWFPKIQFDPANPDEIALNSSISIKIIGGCSPYTWSVSGTGFSLEEPQTTGLTNTLITDDTACGTATITVTGCFGPPETGYVRSTTGQWGNTIFLCGNSLIGCSPCTTTKGNIRVTYCEDCYCPDTCYTCENYFIKAGECFAPGSTLHWCENPWLCGGNNFCGPGQPGHYGLQAVQQKEWICP